MVDSMSHQFGTLCGPYTTLMSLVRQNGVMQAKKTTIRMSTESTSFIELSSTSGDGRRPISLRLMPDGDFTWKKRENLF